MFASAELGHRIDKATYRHEEPLLREALLDAQFDLAEAKRFPVIILIGGVDRAGRSETVNQLNAWMDPRQIQTNARGDPTDEERERPPMWRFWRALPPRGRIGIFFDSWYTDPIVDRVQRRTSGAELTRSIDEINRFETMLVAEGTLILKFWFHLSKKRQKARFKKLARDPRTRWRVTPSDWQRFKQYDRYRRVAARTLRETSTPQAPWTVVEGANARYRYLTVGNEILRALQERLQALPTAGDEATAATATLRILPMTAPPELVPSALDESPNETIAAAVPTAAVTAAAVPTADALAVDAPANDATVSLPSANGSTGSAALPSAALPTSGPPGSTPLVGVATFHQPAVSPLSAPLPEVRAATLVDGINVLNTLDLSLKLERGEYRALLEEWQGRLSLLTRHPAFKDRAVVAVFEGNDAAGKGGAIRRVTGAMDSRIYHIVPIAAPTDEEAAQPYLWRFWRNLPRLGNVTIFDRSWYGRVLVERVQGFTPEANWRRAYSEINQFEAELTRYGVVLVKFWLAISKDEQERRFQAREATEFKRFKLTPDDWRNRERWDDYVAAVCDMVDRTSTEIAPWTLVEAEDKYYSRIKVLRTLCHHIDAAL
jgi:polyphosphate kinase 2 (PPK2 family)